MDLTPNFTIQLIMTQKKDLKSNEKTQIDLEQLRIESGKSSDKEAFGQVLKGSGYRVGVSVIQNKNGKYTYLIEFLLNTQSGNSGVNLTFFHKIQRITEVLLKHNYTAEHSDGGWIEFRMAIEPDRIESECDFLLKLIEENGINNLRRY